MSNLWTKSRQKCRKNAIFWIRKIPEIPGIPVAKYPGIPVPAGMGFFGNLDTLTLAKSIKCDQIPSDDIDFLTEELLLKFLILDRPAP